MNIKCAIFDFDGTLFDSMPIWKGLKFEFFESIGISLTEEDKKIFSGLFLMDALPLAKDRFNLKESLEDLYFAFWNMLSIKYIEKATPKNDIITFLEKLKQNNVKMGIATATGEMAIIPLLEKYNMLRYFSSIKSTYTVNAQKSNPKVYDVVRNELGFEGVIITDDLEMSGITMHYTLEEAAILAIEAGNDMLIVDHMESQYDAIIQAVRDQRLSEESINASVKRILMMKERLNIINIVE